MGFARDGGADDVDNTTAQGATLKAIAHGENRVGGLTRLRNKDTGVVSENRRLAVKEIRSQFDGDRYLRQLLKDGSSLQLVISKRIMGKMEGECSQQCTSGRKCRRQRTQYVLIDG